MARFLERLIWLLAWLALATLGREACWGAGIDPDSYAFVLVQAPPETGVGCGTGVVMRLPCGHRYVLSCAHGVSTDGMRIKTLKGESSSLWVMAMHKEDDLCLFHVQDESTLDGLPCYSIASEPPRVGDSVYSGGFGLDYRLAIFRGEVLGTITDCIARKHPPAPNEQYEPMGLWFSGPARSGDSGGPVINAKGQIVGVFSGTLDETDRKLGRGIMGLTRIGAGHKELTAFLARARQNCYG